MTCQWCGDCHGPDRLCARAERGLTRRSFLFLFGAGLAAASGSSLAEAGPYQFPIQLADDTIVTVKGNLGFFPKPPFQVVIQPMGVTLAHGEILTVTKMELGTMTVERQRPPVPSIPGLARQPFTPPPFVTRRRRA